MAANTFAGFPRAVMGYRRRKVKNSLFWNSLFWTKPAPLMVMAKRTSKNQPTLPKAVVDAVGIADCYDDATENGRIVLTPVHPNAASHVRSRLEELGITEADVAAAVTWSR